LVRRRTNTSYFILPAARRECYRLTRAGGDGCSRLRWRGKIGRIEEIEQVEIQFPKDGIGNLDGEQLFACRTLWVRR